MFYAVQTGNDVAFNHKRFVCDTMADMNEIDVSKIAVGSTALVLDPKEQYVLSNARKWVLVISYSGNGGGGGGAPANIDVASVTDTKSFLNI